jgi:integrase
MAARMERTRHAGIWRRGSRYVFSYRLRGKQRWESARTLSEAQRLKARRSADADRGELHERSRLTFREYAEEWVEGYTGRGSSGFRESTREDYRRDLKRWVFPYFGDQLKLTDLTPRDVAQLVADLAKQEGQRGPLADTTIRSILNPVRACLATAVEDGLLRTNPAQRVRLPHRPKPQDEDGKQVRALTREQLAAFLEHGHPRHRLMFRVLASTGLRVSELLALQWRHLELDGSGPCVRVRRANVRGAPRASEIEARPARRAA